MAYRKLSGKQRLDLLEKAHDVMAMVLGGENSLWTVEVFPCPEKPGKFDYLISTDLGETYEHYCEGLTDYGEAFLAACDMFVGAEVSLRRHIDEFKARIIEEVLNGDEEDR